MVRINITIGQYERFRAMLTSTEILGRLRMCGEGVTRLSSEIDLKPEIALWCNEYLVEGCVLYWDVSTGSASLIFKSQADFVAFKMRWW
jgi:hypothetical protein